MTWCQKLNHKLFGWDYVVVTKYNGFTSTVRVRRFANGEKYVRNFNGSIAFLRLDGTIGGKPIFGGDYVSWVAT